MDKVPEEIIASIAALREAAQENKNALAQVHAPDGSPRAIAVKKGLSEIEAVEKLIARIEAHPNPPLTLAMIDEVAAAKKRVDDATALALEETNWQS